MVLTILVQLVVNTVEAQHHHCKTSHEDGIPLVPMYLGVKVGGIDYIGTASSEYSRGTTPSLLNSASRWNTPSPNVPRSKGKWY